jgi:hypothetical protein
MKKSSLFALLYFVLPLSASFADSNIIVDSSIPVSGITQNAYANMWWQWAVSMPASESPVRDRVGVKCHVNQTGPVWFLAGGYGSSRINRKCSIPSDKYIFFPVINMVYYNRNTKRRSTCRSVKRKSSLNNQYLKSFKVSIDDEVFVNPVLHRIGSDKCFDLIARKVDVREDESAYPAATDGYWVMLRPLQVGRHKISFNAEYNRPGGSFGRTVQDINYDITVYQP